MAKVKAKVLCFVDNGLRQTGDTFEYDGPFNHHLEYLDGVEPAKNDEGSAQPKLRVGRKPKAEAAATE